MRIEKAELDGIWVVEPRVFGDHRGWFMESFSEAIFEQAGINIHFVQDNHSYSSAKGTLRGLHYQLNPKAQTKLVRCTKGSIFDVVVDIRRGSPTYGHWLGIELSETNKKQLLVTRGFAHGFMTLTEETEIQYKVDTLYAPAYERAIQWNDPDIGIHWPLSEFPILSDKDEKAPRLACADNNFEWAGQRI